MQQVGSAEHSRGGGGGNKKKGKAVQGAIPSQGSGYSGYSQWHQAERSSSKVLCKSECPFTQWDGGYGVISSRPPRGCWLNAWLCSQGSKNGAEPFWGLNTCKPRVCMHRSPVLSRPPSLPATLPRSLPSAAAFQNRAGTEAKEPQNHIECKRTSKNSLQREAEQDDICGRNLIIVNLLGFTLHQQSVPTSLRR